MYSFEWISNWNNEARLKQAPIFRGFLDPTSKGQNMAQVNIFNRPKYSEIFFSFYKLYLVSSTESNICLLLITISFSIALQRFVFSAEEGKVQCTKIDYEKDSMRRENTDIFTISLPEWICTPVLSVRDNVRTVHLQAMNIFLPIVNEKLYCSNFK